MSPFYSVTDSNTVLLLVFQTFTAKYFVEEEDGDEEEEVDGGEDAAHVTHLETEIVRVRSFHYNLVKQKKSYLLTGLPCIPQAILEVGEVCPVEYQCGCTEYEEECEGSSPLL